MVGNAYNASNSGAEIRRITVQGQLRQKLNEDSSQPTNQEQWCTLAIPAMQKT
jgi:hypothetical protein